MKVIVTGAAGSIGSHTSERLKDMGNDVIGIDNFSPYYDLSLKKLNELALTRKGIKVLNIDLRYNDLSEVFTEEIDYIFHFAAQPGISSDCTFEDYYTNNILGTQRILDVLEALNKKTLFHQYCYLINLWT